MSSFFERHSLRQNVRRVLGEAFDRVGLYASRRRALPRGFDWLLDVERSFSPGKPRTVLDVGANVGQTTLSVRKRFPEAAIHAFEPVSSTFATLRSSVGHLRGVHCHDVALSDQEGSRTISVLPGSVFNSLNDVSWAGEQRTVREEIKTTTVDRFCTQHAIDVVDILKSDTEGHDLNVLKGALETLSKVGSRCVYVEVTFNRDNPNNSQFDDINQFLQALGYRFMGLYEMDFFQINPWGRSFCNALFWKT
jgi:FkbM family methyltransferase